MKKFFSFSLILGLAYFLIITPLMGMKTENTAMPDDGSWLLCTDETLETLSSESQSSPSIGSAYHTETTERQDSRRGSYLKDRYHAALANVTALIETKSTPHLKINSDDRPNAVVFDVDDTTLLSPGALALIDATIPYPRVNQLLPVPCMSDLCKFFEKNECVFIFLTARREEMFQDTIENLLSVGYKINRLICMPLGVRILAQKYTAVGQDQDASTLIARWKSLEIRDLMTLYNIVAFIDDSEDNIAEGEKILPGRCFRVPYPDEV